MLPPQHSPLPSTDCGALHVGQYGPSDYACRGARTRTPWLSFRLLRGGHAGEEEYVLEQTLIYRVYNKTLRPIIDSPKKSWLAIGAGAGLLLIAVSFLFLRLVKVKMLPFDNKSEVQVIIDMPEGTTLEQTAVVARKKDFQHRRDRAPLQFRRCRPG